MEKPKEAFVNPAFENNYSDYLETWSPYRATDHVALISMPNSTVRMAQKRNNDIALTSSGPKTAYILHQTSRDVLPFILKP